MTVDPMILITTSFLAMAFIVAAFQVGFILGYQKARREYLGEAVADEIDHILKESERPHYSLANKNERE